MGVGDLVKWLRIRNLEQPIFGIIIEIPPEDDYWGKTAVVQWNNGLREEITEEHIEVIPCK